ncbi:AMP-binding protein [uncultured Albimonas sp.]|uniref:AMP-binding protein n=1 Tax=uncultured Albimonas sp. TaxID=1331701 RepID=UPI0030EF6B25
MDNSVTMGELSLERARIRRLARHVASGLAELGVAPEEPVTLLMRNDPEFLSLVTGIELIGATATPVNWHFTPDEISHILLDSGARVLFAHSDLWRKVRAEVDARARDRVAVILVDPPAPLREAYGIEEADRRIEPGERELLAWAEGFEPVPDRPKPVSAGMIYTSGTTGKPKGVKRLAPIGVQRTHNHDAYVPWMRNLLAAPVYHSAPYRAATATFAIGGELFLQPRFREEEFLALIERRRITHAFMVPTMFIRLLRLPQEVRARHDLSSLRHVVHAGAPCPPDVKRRMIDWFGPVIFEFYGGTETGAVTYCTSQEWLDHPGTVGRATPDSRIRVRDEAGRDLPPGEPGEIWCRLATYPDFTYLNRPEARAEMERDGLLSIGDVGFLDADGYLFITDRKRDMIISGGSNIYCNMIEAVMIEHPAVADCAAFGIPDEELGEALAVAVEPAEGHGLDEASVVDFAKTRLKGYMVPRRVMLVDALPRDPSGKIFKRKLRDPFWEGRERRI